MKTLEDIKESLSNEYFLGSNWDELPDDQKVMLIDKLCHRAQEEALKNAAERFGGHPVRIEMIRDSDNIVK